MSARENFLAMLKEAGIQHQIADGIDSEPDTECVRLVAGEGNVVGYAGFEAWFTFDLSGKLRRIEIAE